MEAFLKHLDHPVLFALFLTMTVIAGTYLLGWGFSSLGWAGPQQLTKGYGA